MSPWQGIAIGLRTCQAPSPRSRLGRAHSDAACLRLVWSINVMRSTYCCHASFRGAAVSIPVLIPSSAIRMRGCACSSLVPRPSARRTLMLKLKQLNLMRIANHTRKDREAQSIAVIC